MGTPRRHLNPFPKPKTLSSMSGEKDLDILLRSLSAQLIAGEFVFCTLQTNEVPTGVTPMMVFREAEGTTLIVPREVAEEYALKHEFPCRMITLDVHSSLDAVGFIARIASLFAEHGLPVNPVSGFYHDHLFVPVGSEDKALHLLRQLADGTA